MTRKRTNAPTRQSGNESYAMDSWAERDADLIDDVKYERQVMDDLYNYLYTKNHPLRYWYYGHFHESWHAEIDDVMFHMLDIMELREIPPKEL